MKKALAFLLSALMLLSSMAAVVSAGDFYLEQEFKHDDTFILGDVNDDGTVNAMDSYYLKTSLAGVCEVELNSEAYDFDADSKLGAPDSYSLKVCLAGVMTTADFENGKQVYKMTIGGTPFLDNEYTVFGEVVEGLEVIDAIAAVQTMPGDRPKSDLKMKIEVVK